MPIREMTESVYMSALRRAIKTLGFQRPVLWLFLPEMGIFVNRFDEKLVIYHIVDEYAGYSGVSPQWRPVIRDMEECLAGRADLVVVTSPDLLERKRHLNQHVVLVPNAVDYDAFAEASRPDVKPPQDMADVRRPVAGYVGAINDKLDLPLLDRTAASASRWSFVFVGPVVINTDDGQQALDALRARPNVRLLGAKEVKEVPRYVAACDVCLLPYRINEWTKHIDSLKLYEYLACGKPIVATEVPAARRFEEAVEIVAAGDDMAAGLEAALSEDSPARQAKRRQIARQNTWDERVSQLSDAIERRLGEKAATDAVAVTSNLK
jgi:glycosyltransferase involved in cell wall biosynthesis